MKLTSFFLIFGVGIASAQMKPDPNFNDMVAHPAYTANHPRVAIDQAHDNVHTKDGLFKPFADLLQNNGYDVVANTSAFTPDGLKGIDILIIANATGELSNDNNNSTPAFAKAECDAVYEWVRQGGSLFLAATSRPSGRERSRRPARAGAHPGNKNWANRTGR